MQLCLIVIQWTMSLSKLGMTSSSCSFQEHQLLTTAKFQYFSTSVQMSSRSTISKRSKTLKSDLDYVVRSYLQFVVKVSSDVDVKCV